MTLLYKKKVGLFLLVIVLAFIFSGSSFVLADYSPVNNPNPEGTGIIPCDGSDAHPCGWGALVELASRAISFLIYLSVFIAAIAFTIAGFKYLTAAGDEGKAKSARSIFTNVAVGLLFVLGAFLLVKVIL